MSAVTPQLDGLVVRLYIQPKASRDQIIGLHGDEIKVAITAPPVDGQANAHLIKFIAKQFKVAKSNVIIEKRRTRAAQAIAHPQPATDP
ncbi:Uncharacterised ACR, YggU family COG1872 [Serratia fonticola]|uniref:UPF0235 protein NCTC12965_01509 n=1 Tax=Serratia fonticola TaxID=47917 RepID=A0A4U9TT08_SERFO|nr:Uncharacterised ACR, YggU family COG1872 [Serratia fonticola]